MSNVLQRFITKGMINRRGSNAFNICHVRVNYWGYEENAEEVHDLAQSAWPNLMVRTYSVDMGIGRDGIKRPVVKRVI